MVLLQRFKDFITVNKLFTPVDHLLLAVSGGVDSVVLCELCYLAGFTFTIAHCNFQLRGEASERDEQFVRSLGTRYGVQVLVKRFDTQVYAQTQKVSIQVAARELRYAWFGELMNTKYEAGSRKPEILNTKYEESGHVKSSSDTTINNKPATINYLLTAHHQDDNVETVLMNFFKGTGIAGLRGILPKQGHIVRPLLFARKEELMQFAIEESVTWVEDASNAEDKYSRNYVRHQVVPVIEKLFPEALQNIAANLLRFRDIEVLYRQSVDRSLKKLLTYKGEEVHIPVLKLQKSEPLSTLVYEIITPCNFTPAQVPELIRLLESETGKYIASATHRIVKNRQWLVMAPLAATAQSFEVIEAGNNEVTFERGRLSFKSLPITAYQPQAPATMAQLDADAIRFPLLLRPWKSGDYFYPLGMPKKKKVARFLIDQKVSAINKEKVWVLEMNKKIIWVAGMRIDDRFKITAATKKLLQISLAVKE